CICDLTLHLSETMNGIEGYFEYSADLFDTETIKRMEGHLRTVLDAVIADPNQRISDLPIMPEAERRQLLADWNRTEAKFSNAPTLVALFESQVQKTPDAVAVTSDGKSLTYLELNQRASQLAQYVRERGIGPDMAVGICVKRSLEMVVGIF